MADQKRFIIGVTGASGSIYALHFLRALCETSPGESELIVSSAALRVLAQESGETVTDPLTLLGFALRPLASSDRRHQFRIQDKSDIGARAASGSAKFDGMVIVPCSTNTLSAVAHGQSTNLIERAADVCLKERRRLILVPRETPYSRIHLENMLRITDAGGIILPASPGFYHRPKTLDDLGRFMAGRILSLLGVEHSIVRPWDGEGS